MDEAPDGYDVASTRDAGRTYRDPLAGETALYGLFSGRTVDRESLLDLLDRHS